MTRLSQRAIAPLLLGFFATSLGACAAEPAKLIQLRPGTTVLVTEAQTKGKLAEEDGCFVLRTPRAAYTLVTTRAYSVRDGKLVNDKTGDVVPMGKWLGWEGSESVISPVELVGDLERCKPPYFLTGNNNNAWSEK